MQKWLGIIGQVLLKATEILAGVGPLFPTKAAQVGVVVSDLAQIDAIIVNVEAMGQVVGLSGEQKLAAAAPLVAQIILQSTALAGHEIANHDLFMQGVTKIASGTADVLNSRKV